MNPILVEQLAKQRMDTFDREAEADRLVALARLAAPRPVGLRGLFERTAGRVRLIVRVAGA